MLKGEYDHLGRLCQLSDNLGNFVRPWGVELSDGYRFFTMDEDSQFGINEQRRVEAGSNGSGTRVISELELPSGKIMLSSTELVDSNSVFRTTAATFVDAIDMIDVVVRFVFDPDFVSSFSIGGFEVPDDRSNLYYQADVTSVSFKVHGRDASIEVLESIVPTTFKTSMYVKSHPAEGWVVHVRVVPLQQSGEVLRVRGRRMPSLFARFVSVIPFIGARIRHARELNRLVGKFAQSLPLGRVPASSSIELKTRFSIH